VIDLHLHTTASDGTLSPAQLVAAAAAAGLRTISVTDHDTTAGLREAADAARAAGLTLVPGIEITAVEAGRDVHVLGYFVDPQRAALAAFLEQQRGDRVRRVRTIAERLHGLGCPLDVEALIDRASRSTGRSIGRPHIADALIAAGHVRDRDEAFERFLGRSCPAFVPRSGEPPERVIEVIRDSGGIASLAHPGPLRMDDLIARLATRGLSAVEVRHPDHDAAAERHYRALAAQHGLAVSGGSDYHGGAKRGETLGSIALPADDFARLQALTA
jgi:3',5'-nucleoside bisphosphate phosphatase